MTARYTVVVFATNSWTEDRHGQRFPVVERSCGHEHRTISGALRCERKLRAYDPATRTQSASWYHAVVRHADYSPLTDDEQDELL